MKHLLLTTIAAVLLVGTAFADPIHDAAEDGDLAGVQAELDKDVDVNVNNKLVGSDGGTPLHYAAHKEIAELLIANGADVNAQNDYGETPLDYDAWYNSETEIADLLRAHGGKHGVINGAAAGGNIEAVKEFLVAGTDGNVKDGWGWTPLHNAAWWGHKEIAELLLANGADVDAKDEDGYTPLHPHPHHWLEAVRRFPCGPTKPHYVKESIPTHPSHSHPCQQPRTLLLLQCFHQQQRHLLPRACRRVRGGGRRFRFRCCTRRRNQVAFRHNHSAHSHPHRWR
jgi:hypothetical protein